MQSVMDDRRPSLTLPQMLQQNNCLNNERSRTQLKTYDYRFYTLRERNEFLM